MIPLDHRFRVPLPVDEAWEILTDLPTIARCLPGAHLDSVVDGRYEGGISTRIGPISARYRGSAHFVERDEVGHRAVIEARGREAEGAGTATVVVTLALQPDGQGTEVTISSEPAHGGRAAPFDRSRLAEVSTSMLDTFVRSLEAAIDAAREQAREPADLHPASVLDAVDPADDARLDVLRSVLVPIARRSTSYLVGAAFGLLTGIVLGRAGGRGRNRLHERSVLAVPKPG
jgi:hypothetical protein